MNPVGVAIVVVIALLIISLIGWLLASASLVRVPSGSLGLLMVRGQATDTALSPGPHIVPALRQKVLEVYPSVELSYHAGGADTTADPTLDRYAPPLAVTLGDRTSVTVPYSVRFRLMPERLRDVHERFGPRGYFGAVRDASQSAVGAALRAPAVTADDMFGTSLGECETTVGAVVAAALAQEGFELVSFAFGAPELGHTGEVIQATARARHELDREQAQAPTRAARASNDADLGRQLSLSTESAWRYRETEVWAELGRRTGALHLAPHPMVPGGPPGAEGDDVGPAGPDADADVDA